MKKIDIKSKKYPGTIVKVSDEDHEAVIKYKWYLSHKPNKEIRIDAINCYGNRKIELTHFIYERMNPSKSRNNTLLHVNNKPLDFTRNNIVRSKEAFIVKAMVAHDNKKKKIPDGNDYCAGLEANMALRRNW
jgi:hypothetical protein